MCNLRPSQVIGRKFVIFSTHIVGVYNKRLPFTLERSVYEHICKKIRGKFDILKMAMVPRRLQLHLLQLQLQQEEEEDQVVVAAALVGQLQEKLERRRRRWWVRPWIQRRQL